MHNPIHEKFKRALFGELQQFVTEQKHIAEKAVVVADGMVNLMGAYEELRDENDRLRQDNDELQEALDFLMDDDEPIIGMIFVLQPDGTMVQVVRDDERCPDCDCELSR